MNNKMKILNRSVRNVCIIGDVHSSPNELRSIIKKSKDKGITRFISLGDLWDRGYDPNGVTEIIHEMIKNNELDIIMGNHDYKFIRHFAGQKVSISHEQTETLDKLTQKSIELLYDIFIDQPVAIYDPFTKVFISHAFGGRPYNILRQDHRKNPAYSQMTFESYIHCVDDKVFDKKHVSNLLYGITNGLTTENGRPVRLPITKSIDDELDGWVYVAGHHHYACLFPENGNKHCVCVDFCSGEPGGKLAGLIVKENGIIEEGNLIFAE